MSRWHAVLWAGFVMALMLMPQPEGVRAQEQQADRGQAAQQDTSAAAAQVDEISGQEREVTFEEAITAQPARPLIQFTHIRPAVSFSSVHVGPSDRDFMAELLKGPGMDVGSPIIDIWDMYPSLMP